MGIIFLVSSCPVDPGSSSDGGVTIHNDNPDLEKRLQLVASILNLKPHYVWDWQKKQKTMIYTAVDWLDLATHVIPDSLVRDILDMMDGST